MKSRSTLTDRISGKLAMAGRLRPTREEIYGQDGAAKVARRLGLPTRSWLNYECGVTIPGHVLLLYLVANRIEPAWMLDGDGVKYRGETPGSVTTT